MQRPLRGAIIASIALGSLGACNLDYFNTEKFAGGSYRPTVAVPIAQVDVTMAELLKSFESDIILTDEPSDTGTREFLTLVFADTLEPLTLPTIIGGAAAVIPGLKYSLPVERVDLRIFGTLKDGSFNLTNPRVDFRLDNTTGVSYEMEFRDGLNNDFYTQKVDGTQTKYLEITDAAHPYPIPANDFYEFSLDNDNLVYPESPGLKAMTTVVEPTPKYLFYGIDLTTTSSSTDLTGEVGVVASVFLPLRGYGFSTRKDTFKYEFLNTDTAGAELNFAELRFNITNGLPLTGEIFSAEVIDTTQTPWVKMMDIPLYNTDGTIDPRGVLIEGATGGSATNDWVYTPAIKTSDIILSNDIMVQPVVYGTSTPVGLPISQIAAMSGGNKMMVEVNLKTSKTNADPNTEVKFYSDQSLNIKIGIRAQANIDLGAELN